MAEEKRKGKKRGWGWGQRVGTVGGEECRREAGLDPTGSCKPEQEV